MNCHLSQKSQKQQYFKVLRILFRQLSPQMQNRLVAENVFKVPLKGEIFFSINKKLLGYSLEQSLKIKSFNKEGKQYEIKMVNNEIVKSFEFSFRNPWVYVCTSSGILQIYALNEQNSEPITKILSVKGVLMARQVNETIVLDCQDNFYRVLPFDVIISSMAQNRKQIQLQKLNSLQKKSVPSTILQFPQNQNIYIKSTLPKTQEQVITVYSLKKTGKYQKTLEIDYIKNPIAIYKDRYVFSLNKEGSGKNSSVEIYDINQQKLIGKIDIQGELKYTRIRENMMLLIMNTDNTDFYWFCALNPKPDSTSTLITHKIVYQRGKGDFYDFCNMKSTEALNFTDKKKQQQLNDLLPEQVDSTTNSIIYVLNKQKEKVEIIKLDHPKLLESPFGEEKIEKKVESNIVKNKAEGEKQAENQQNERVRIKSSLEHKAHHGKTLQETQRKFVEAIVDVKVRGMMQKFEELEQRVERLQRSMKMIYEKIQHNVKSINREEIRTSVQSLFEQLTPQFEKYFSELFKQVSGVLDQGVNFYNKKLAAQAEIHKQALNQIVVKTFEETEKLIEISKKEEKLSERTEKNLNDLLDARKKWQHKTEEFEHQNREVTVSDTKVYREPAAEGKVFVRADLSKKET